MTTLVWLVIALPLAGAAILLLAGRRSDGWGHLLGCLAALASFGAGVVLFVDMLGRHAEDRVVHEALFSWVPVAGLQVDFGLQLDALSMCFVLLITGVGGRRVAIPLDTVTRLEEFAKERIELRLEHSRGVSSWLAGQELFLDRVRSVEEVSAIIDGVSAQDVQRVARQYLRPELSYIAAVGPRAAIVNVTVPGAEVVDMEIAS